MKPLKIGVIGSNMMDLTSQITRMPRMGETIPARSFDLGYGGKGCNQAVAAAKLGADVIMVTKVGDDLFGPGVAKNLHSHGISIDHVSVAAGHHSGVAPIFVDPHGQNAILIIKDANDCLEPADIDAAARDLRNCDLLLLQLELAEATIYYCIEQAKKWGIPLILNPAPYMPIDRNCLVGIDFVIPNEHELALLVDRELSTEQELESAAQELQIHTGRTVIVTVGARGSLLASGQGTTWVPPYPVKAVDTTGAGDSFIGGFAVFYGRSRDIRQSMVQANRYAALSTLRVGTQKSFLSITEWEDELQNGGGRQREI